MLSNIVLIFALLGGSNADPFSSTIPLELNLDLQCEDPNDSLQVELEPVATVLANEHVPVWIVEEENPTELKPVKVMEELGPFTAYQDLDSCSAALYFHKTEQFEGIMGHLYAMHKLKYNAVMDTVEVTEDTLYESPIPKHDNRFVEDGMAPIKTAGNIKPAGALSLGKYPDIVYIETLVVINYDITEDLESDYAEVVTYILTLFNSVDMLYSKFKIPEIKINIAGIIIGNKKNSFPLLERCYEKLEDQPLEILTDCVNQAVVLMLHNYQLPFQSFDIVVFLTRCNLGHFLTKSDGQTSRYPPASLRGIAYWPNNIGYRKLYSDVGVAIISDPKNFQNFPTVAHEMAHLLGVPHDVGPLWARNGKCLGHLMKRHESICKKCLPFGGRTPEHLKSFFGTRDACIFHNKPRSLENPAGPRLFWEPREQCECYGYKSPYKPRKLFGVFPRARLDCGSTLKCVDEDGTIHDTTLYMDGTPCKKNRRRNKVCWNKQCVRVQQPVQESCKSSRRIRGLHI